MSLNINKDNIYLVVPKGRYQGSQPIGDFMEEDFSVFIRAKLNKKLIPKNENVFLFSRNGLHSGISMYLDNNNEVYLQCGYWIRDNDNELKYLETNYKIPEEKLDNFNDFFINCDNKTKKISFYMNNIKVSELDYSNGKKHDHSESFIWLGCGDMISDNEFSGIGNFDIDVIICLDKFLTINQIDLISQHYKEKYIKIDKDYHLPILSDDIPHKENYRIFCDFSHINKYKMWNMVDNGVFFQKYIENNIFF